MAITRLEKTLVIEIPSELYTELDWASQDGSKPAILRLSGPVPILVAVLTEALQVLNS